MRKVKNACAILICLSGILYACMGASGGQPSSTALPATIVASGHHCLKAPAAWHATFLTAPDQLEAFVSRCRADRIGFAPGDVPVVDFDQWRILAVEMGRQPSAGYGFDADGLAAHVAGRIVTVRLSVRRPPPGALVAQMITTPWILIRLPCGAYRSAQVLDQQGRLLVQIDSPG